MTGNGNLTTLINQATTVLHTHGRPELAAAVQQLALCNQELTAHIATLTELLERATQLATLAARNGERP